MTVCIYRYIYTLELCIIKNSSHYTFDGLKYFYFLCPFRNKEYWLPKKNAISGLSISQVVGCLTVHLPHEIIWNANWMQPGNFINVFLARHVSGIYAHHQEH